MSRRQNDKPSDGAAKRMATIAELERSIAEQRERLEEERLREAAEAQRRAEEERRRAAEARQQQARGRQVRVEVPRRSASPVASRSGASGSSSRYVASHYSNMG
jgi:predicted nucleic acid-binding protein